MVAGDKLTIIVTKGSLDWGYPPFILASTAVALGKDVSMFFTFYGLKLLVKDLTSLKVTPVGNPAMPMKLPVGPNWLQNIDFANKLPNVLWQLPGMEALATTLMKKTMAKKGVSELSDLRAICLESGVKMIACQMTVDLFGYESDDFIEGIDFAGAATYFADSDGASQSLFI